MESFVPTCKLKATLFKILDYNPLNTQLKTQNASNSNLYLRWISVLKHFLLSANSFSTIVLDVKKCQEHSIIQEMHKTSVWPSKKNNKTK